MKELFTMWRNTRMIVLTGVCAGLYVAVLVPFKGFVLIPGLTEIRPGAAVPVALSLLFGPAAAWGSGFGNLVADALGGMLGPGSIFGFLGNFIYGYLPYALWRALNRDPRITNLKIDRLGRSGKTWFFFPVIIVSCMAIGSVIGWGADLLKLAPFAALGLIIAVNNLIAAMLLATPLVVGLTRLEKWGLLYYQIMDESEDEQTQYLPVPRFALLGAVLCIVGVVLAFSTGLLVSAEFLDAGFGAAAFSSNAAGSSAVSFSMLPGLILLIAGMLLL